MKRVVIGMMFLATLMAGEAAQAKPKPWVVSTATVGGAMVGQAIGGVVGRQVVGATDPYQTGGGLGLWAHTLFFGVPMGASLGGAAGAVVGHAAAGGDRVGKVALATGVTGVSSYGLLGLAPYSGKAITPMWATGATGAMVGVPVAAGLSSRETKGSRMQVSVAPSISRKFKGVSLSARF